MKLILLFLVLLGGCHRQISNEEIVKQTLICEEAGLEARLRYDGWTLEPKDILCVPTTPTGR